MGRAADLVWFIGTPALVLPVVLAGERVLGGKALYALVMAFGALGHHLPGMMRAYGDRALFARFRTRFLVAPVFLIALCALFALRAPGLAPVLLLTYLWGVWHGLMQTHGFLRIYDAKHGTADATTARWDQALCLAWFVAAVLFSATRSHHVLQKFYESGGPAVPQDAVLWVRTVWAAFTAVVTAGAVLHTVRRARAGFRPSAVKWLLLFNSVAFWWYANVAVQSLLVGLVLFELFHDVQYLAIVWVYNRGRARTSTDAGTFTQALFGAARARAVLYVGLVFAYGALSFVPKVPASAWSSLFTAILAASTLLHFYFDSFIWKVREAPVRSGLGIASAAAAPGAPGSAGPGWLRRRGMQALRWGALAAPALVLFHLQVHPRLTRDQAMTALGRAFPGDVLAQSNLAVALLRQNDPVAALPVARRVLELGPADPDLAAKARMNLLWSLMGTGLHEIESGALPRARMLLQEAAGLDPGVPELLARQEADAARRGDTVRARTLGVARRLVTRATGD